MFVLHGNILLQNGSIVVAGMINGKQAGGMERCANYSKY